MAIIKKQMISIAKCVEKQENFYTVSGNVIGIVIMKSNKDITQKIKNRATI